MKFISWEEAKEITENYFAPFRCVVDVKESDYENLISFVVYYDHAVSSHRYGPHVISKFQKRQILEKYLAYYKKDFNEAIKSI